MVKCIESEPKSTRRAIDEAVVLTPILNIAKKARRAFSHLIDVLRQDRSFSDEAEVWY